MRWQTLIIAIYSQNYYYYKDYIIYCESLTLIKKSRDFSFVECFIRLRFIGRQSNHPDADVRNL